MSLQDACGCEPVRKDSSSEIKLDADSDHTEWIPPIKVADFLLKLYTGEAYDAGDQVIHLEPATVSHEDAVAEDPGFIDPTIFNYSADQVPDLHGIREGEMLIDEIIVFLAKELLEAYPVQELEIDPVTPTPLAHPKVYFAPPAAAYLYTQEEWTLDPEDKADQAGIEILRNLVLNYTYFVYLVHTGPDRSGGHYYCVVYNKITSTLVVLDSASSDNDLTPNTEVFVDSFIKTLKIIDLHPPKDIKVVVAPSLQQIDGNSCGFYAIHNTHRIFHALCRGGLEDDPKLFDKFITKTGKQKLSDLPKLTPKLITEWRIKLRRVYYEKMRRIRKVLTFCDLRNIQSQPDYHSTSHAWHISKNKGARLYMTPKDRVSIDYSTGNNMPYDLRFIPSSSLEHFTPDSVFAQLERDWKQKEVAGVIIRLSQSSGSTKQQMYRAVGWDQIVLLSCLPHSTKGYNLNRPSGKPITKKTVIDNCKQEIVKLTQSSPSLNEDELNIQLRYLIGMHCVDTPKIIITTNHDGATWAKINWACNRDMREMGQISINGIGFRTVSGCMVRLPDYAYIILGGAGSPYRAHYIWAQKWPHNRIFRKKTNLIPKAIPYVNPGVWNWWDLDDLLQEYQIEYKDPDLDYIGGPHLNKWSPKSVPMYKQPTLRKNAYLKVSDHSDNNIIKAIRDIPGIVITSPKHTVQTKKRKVTITSPKHTVQTKKRKATPTSPKHTVPIETQEEKITPIPKRRRVRDASTYLELDPIDVDDSNDSAPSTLHAYLANLLIGMNENDEVERPSLQYGHFHHHHRPYQTIIDHQWRVRYYTQLQPGRFPWPDGTPSDIETMIHACQTIQELKQEMDPVEANEWKKLAHLLKFGEKTLRLWHSKSLRSKQTMRCMSHKCEKLRRLCLRFENTKSTREENYWEIYEQYQQWKYGAQDCPKDCPLRAFDCPADCRVVHSNPLDINKEDLTALTKILTGSPPSPSQSRYIEAQLDRMFPQRLSSAPPHYWMPVRALKGFWDPQNGSPTALKARTDVCIKRLNEWHSLSKSDQNAILKGMDEVYYDDVKQYFKDADWKGKSREAQARALNYAKRRSNNRLTFRPYIQTIYNYMQTKLKQDSSRPLIDWEAPRKIDPNEITFASLSEFW